MFVLALLILLVGPATTSGAHISPTICNLDLYRLSKRIEPTHYELRLRPVLELFKFDGELTIEVLVNDQGRCGLSNGDRMARFKQVALDCMGVYDKSQIILHITQHLTINQVEFVTGDGEVLGVRESCRDPKNEIISFKFDRPLKHNTVGKLKLKYNGLIRKDLSGFYASAYIDSKGRKRHFGVTQFEAASARSALPCFDEPDFKATFDVSIEHETGLTALSNMELLSDDEIKPGLRLAKFARTPVMSTYLLAWTVGEFERLKWDLLGGQLELSVYTPPGKLQGAKFALEVASRGYEALNKYFGVEQPLKKIDLVAVPDFEQGAMENWGLITFRDIYLLEGKHSLPAMKSDIASTVIHELAHQWFGNLVTMKWWNDLWLNEGFATWISSDFVHELFPDFQQDLLYVLDSHSVALDADFGPDTHPISNDQLQTPKEIEQSFDDITYSKSSSVIRLLNDYIGRETFQEAIQEYLVQHRFGNTDANDLWEALETASGKPVKRVMGSWIYQAGYPLISVRLTSDSAKSHGSMLHLEQKRFAKQLKKFSQESRQRWSVPVNILVSDGGDRNETIKVLLDTTDKQVALPEWFSPNRAGHWLKLNAGYKGLYRVKYSSDLLQLMREPVERKQMEPVDRINLVDELFALYNEGRIEFRELDEVLDWFRDEEDGGVLSMLSMIVNHFNKHPIRFDKAGGRRHNLFEKFYKKNGFSVSGHESFLEMRGKGAVLRQLVLAKYEPAIKDALELFDATQGQVPKFLRSAVYGAVGINGTYEQFKHMVSLMDDVEVRDERFMMTTVVLRTGYLGRRLWIKSKLRQ